MKVLLKLIVVLFLIALAGPIALTAADTIDLGPARVSMNLEGIGPYNIEMKNQSPSDHSYVGYAFTYKFFPATIKSNGTGNQVLIEVQQLSSPQPLDMPILQLNGKIGLEHCVEESDMMPPGNVQRQMYYVDGHKGIAFIVNRDQKGSIYLAAYSPDMKDGFGDIVIIIGSDFPLDITKRIFESITVHLVQEDMIGESNTVLGMGNVNNSNIGSGYAGMGSMIQGNMTGQGGMMAMMQSCMSIMQSMGSGNMTFGNMGSGNAWNQVNLPGQGNTIIQGNKTIIQSNMTGQDGLAPPISPMIGSGNAGSLSKSRWDLGNTPGQGNMMSLAVNPINGEQLLMFSALPLIILVIGFIVARLELNGNPPNYKNKKANEFISSAVWAEQFKRSLAIAKKNVRIYYSRGPVVIFGLMFPLVLLVAFTIGRNIGIMELFPGIMGMVIFFASTAMGPGILPWETRSRNLERLVSSPIAIWALFLGDVLASFAFGMLISVVPLVIAVLMGVKVANFLVLGLGIVLATFCFASLGILLSVYPPTDVPATVMMVSSLVKFPIVFISGVFVPIGHMHDWGIKIASISPLTYFTDLATYSITGVSYFSIQTDLGVLAFFTALFLVASIKLHEKFLPQRLS